MRKAALVVTGHEPCFSGVLFSVSWQCLFLPPSSDPDQNFPLWQGCTLSKSHSTDRLPITNPTVGNLDIILNSKISKSLQCISKNCPNCPSYLWFLFFFSSAILWVFFPKHLSSLALNNQVFRCLAMKHCCCSLCRLTLVPSSTSY